MKLMSDTDSE